MEIKELAIDLETFSDVDLKKCGVYKYAESPNFEILLFAYSINNGPVQVIDLAQGEEIPKNILAALSDNNIEKWAYNSQFERICLSEYLRKHHPEHFKSYSIEGDTVSHYLDPSSWKCSRIWGAYMGLPLSLESIGSVLKLQDQKMKEGKDLIRYFCVPCKPTKVNGGRTRNQPIHDKAKWELFKKYNKRDVEVEMAIQDKLSKFPVPEFLWEEYHLDQVINDRGIVLDMDVVKNAITFDEKSKAVLSDKMRRLTGLDNPNSVQQMKHWLAENGLEMDSLGKKEVTEVLRTAPEPLQTVLSLRQQLAKSSVKKYQAMENAVCADERLRGMFRFLGANRTGRWCLTGDHEVLTRHGWRRIDSSFNGKPEIAVYDRCSGKIRFEKSKIVSFKYSGTMYLWESKRVSQLSTPEHRNPITDGHGVKKVKYVANIATNEWLPVGGQIQSDSPARFTDDELRLLVAYQADGIAAGGTRNGLAFRFTKERKIQRMRTLLNNLKYPFREYRHGDGATCIRVVADNYNPQIKTKQFMWWMLNENADVFFDEIGFWDGHIETDTSTQYVTTNRLNAEIVATFAHLSGRAAIINVRQAPENNKWSTTYYVEIWNNISQKGISIPNKPQPMLGYSGNVYCAETSTGFFLVRRCKKIWVTGNSSTTINIQNLPQNHMSDLEQVRGLVRSGNYDAMELLYNDIPDTLSQLIRTAFIPREEYKFIVADFSAIEARVLSFLAGEQWRLDVFEAGGDIYCATAERMFHCKVVKNGENGELRQKGKQAELACGFGGSVGALKAMGALEMGLREEELQPLVDAWRTANPKIVQYWWQVDRAVKKAVKERMSSKVGNITFIYKSGMLFIELPSGRSLCYVKPKMGMNQFGSESVTYEGINGGKWTRIESYGPKFVENIVQAVSRDILAYAMRTLSHTFIVGSVHDELIIECSPNVSVESICEQMGRTPPWISGLLLRADGYECDFYKKD